MRSAILCLLLVATVALADPLPSFGPVIGAAEPAVVNVTSSVTGQRRAPSPPETMDDFMRRFFDSPPGPQGGVGSGFVLSSNGEVVTNVHVVAGADAIRVRFGSGETLDAKVVGLDEKTDIALLRVDPPRPLPALTLGDSTALAVGDWVIAIGNPFGLEHTATVGIVSAKGRFIGAGPYDDFVQTDAAINPGNSGGPLLDQNGRVVGVNAAIVSPAGGNVGIGFAIPIDLTKWVVEQLREHGRVIRGWLGVSVQPVTSDLAQALGLSERRGALVAEVTPGSPAAAAGLRQGDVVVRLGDEPIEESRELPGKVATTPPGATVPVTVLREGGERTLLVKVREAPMDSAPRRDDRPRRRRP
jgi:serine protease Do